MNTKKRNNNNKTKKRKNNTKHQYKLLTCNNCKVLLKSQTRNQPGNNIFYFGKNKYCKKCKKQYPKCYGCGKTGLKDTEWNVLNYSNNIVCKEYPACMASSAEAVGVSATETNNKLHPRKGCGCPIF